MKLIDFDEKFNRKVAEMLEKHAGERTEEEWEDAIAKAYEQFGDTYMGAIGMTPRQYFEKMTESGLVETLKEYILQDVPVPDILCGELGTYAPALLEKPQVIIASKLDEDGAQERLEALRSRLAGKDIHPLSIYMDETVEDVKQAFIHLVATSGIVEDEEGGGFTTRVDNDAFYRDEY